MPAPGSIPISSKGDEWSQKNFHLGLASKVTTPVTKQNLPFTSTTAKTLFRQ